MYKLHYNLLTNYSTKTSHTISPATTPVILSEVTPDEIAKLLCQSTHRDLDPIHISLLKHCAFVLIPTKS